MADSVVSVRNFSKQFNSTPVVRDLSFDVQTGETFAFLGANGSGKTTTIRCLLNILQPTGGELLLWGERYDISMARRIGYLPEERGLYVDSNVLETMVYFGMLKGLSKADAMSKAAGYLDRVGLSEKRQARIKTLSSGQQQKIQLGLTIINSPELLVLDEPTKGLDPVNRDLLLDTLTEMKAAGTTIVFITHQMEEVEKVADRLVMIKDGRRVLYGGVAEVKRQFGENRLHIEFTGTVPVHEKLYSVDRAENNVAELKLCDGVTPDQVFKALAKDRLVMSKFEVASPSLQDIFVHVQSQ